MVEFNQANLLQNTQIVSNVVRTLMATLAKRTGLQTRPMERQKMFSIQ